MTVRARMTDPAPIRKSVPPTETFSFIEQWSPRINAIFREKLNPRRIDTPRPICLDDPREITPALRRQMAVKYGWNLGRSGRTHTIRAAKYDHQSSIAVRELVLEVMKRHHHTLSNCLARYRS